MSNPLVTPDDLATYLSDPTINEDRAQMMIDDAMAACESIVSPVPPGAAYVVKRVAGRGYVTTTAARGAQMAAGGSPFGGAPGGMGGIRLLREDKADLRRASSGSGGAFSVDLLPSGYVAPSAHHYAEEGWDTSSGDILP